jgi:heptosyltransferase II
MKSLIVNLGPSGDIVRTTVLHSELIGEIHWLTRKNYVDLLTSKKINKIYTLESEEDMVKIKDVEFDLVISLNEEIEALKEVNRLKIKKLIGVYLNDMGNIDYTNESKYWFDMSLISKFGKKKSDELKKINKKSVPQMLVEMIGKKWKGQEYDLGIKPNNVSKRIGLINVVTGKWPNKDWYGYEELRERLKKDNYEVEFLGMKPSIKDHIEDINNCELVVCGDTLGMHVALALKKKVITIFNCTSPDEIYDYGRMIKIISPLLDDYFYKKEFNNQVISAVKVEEVYSAITKVLKL